MKKLLIALLLIIMLIPTMGMAAKSPTIKDTISCEPAIPFEIVEDPEMLEAEGFITVEVLSITLDQKYTKVVWHLTNKFEPDAEVKVALIPSGAEYFFVPAECTDEGDIITDFTDIQPGTYLIYFLLSDAA